MSCESSMPSESLDDLLLRVIDETLEDVFKETGVTAIYDYMEKTLQLKRKEIPKKPKTFSTGLKALLDSAAPVIEDMILRNLYQKLDLEFEKKEGYEFLEYIRELRR